MENTAMPISAINDFDFNLKIRSGRIPTFVACWAGKIISQNYEGGKTESRGPFFAPFDRQSMEKNREKQW